MNLAKALLNRRPSFEFLTVPAEQQEVRIACGAPAVRLERSFNQTWPDGSTTKYWRVVGPVSHPNYMSDLSIEGLKEWGIVRWF